MLRIRRDSLFLVVVLLGFAQLALCQNKSAASAPDATASKRETARSVFMQAITDSGDSQLIAFVTQHCQPVVYDAKKGELPIGEKKAGADVRLLVMVGTDNFVDAASKLSISRPNGTGFYYEDQKILAVNGELECSDFVKSIKYAQMAYMAMVVCTEKLPGDDADHKAFVAYRGFSFSYTQLTKRGKGYEPFIDQGVRFLMSNREQSGAPPGAMVVNPQVYKDELDPLFQGPPANKQEEEWRLTFIAIHVLLQDIEKNGGSDKEEVKWKTLKRGMPPTS